MLNIEIRKKSVIRDNVNVKPPVATKQNAFMSIYVLEVMTNTYSTRDATKQKTLCFTYFQWQLVNKNRILILTEQKQAPTLPKNA